MSDYSPVAVLYNTDGYALSVLDGYLIPNNTPSLLSTGKDIDGYARILYTTSLGSLHTTTDSLPVDTYNVITITATTSGNTTIVTPTSGKKIRLHYLTMNADASNTAAVTSAIRFDVAGDLIYKICLVAGSIFARNVGAGRRYIEGAADEELNINLSDDQVVNCTIEYEEVD